MINYLGSAEDVLAIRVRGGLTGEDLDGLIQRLQLMVERHQKTHVFVDVDQLGSDYWITALEALPRALGLLRLRRYGRVAIVSDDTFVRAWSRVESAVLPGLRYEIFHSNDADRALQWVEGKVDEPHPAGLKFLETNNPLVLAYSIDGTIGKADMERAIATLQPRLSSELGPISVLGRFGEVHFSDPANLFDGRYFWFKKAVLARVQRYAIVGGPAWLRVMVHATAPFVPFELRHFEQADEKAAWDWVGAQEAGREIEAPCLKAEALV